MKKRYLSSMLLMTLMMLLSLSFSGCLVNHCHECDDPPPCTWGPNGYAGPAFFGLEWATVQPRYVWTNNTAIPPTFRYGTYYNSIPGNYRLYYEGAYYHGCCLTEYYWDVNFVVWVNAGSSGGCGYAGADGLPAYLMLVMGPNGPGEYRTNKSAQTGVETTLISESQDEITLQYVKGDINVRVSYKRLEHSQKNTLDAKGRRIAE